MNSWDIGNYMDKRNEIKSKIHNCIEKERELQKSKIEQSNSTVYKTNTNTQVIRFDYVAYKKKVFSQTSMKYKYQI